MIARQFGRQFIEFCVREGDPGWGDVVIAGGASWIARHPRRGDKNLYWWWSMGGRRDWLAFYLSSSEARPDMIVCPSARTLKCAEDCGLNALYLPLGVGADFQPLDRERSGIGYAGTRDHKDPGQIACMIEPLRSRFGLEWVDSIRTPDELNEWYNTKKIILGMTDALQEQWGMVNNRVFEVLASGTPLVVHRHRYLEKTLRMEYPYQSASPDETLAWVEEMAHNYRSYEELFSEYARKVSTHHSYTQRLCTLNEVLA